MVMLIFHQNHYFFEKITKTTFFPIFFRNKLAKKIKILKVAFEMLYLLKTSISMLSFLIFASFYQFFWVSCQIRHTFHFCTKFSNFWPYLPWNFNNRQKTTRKWQKTVFFCDFFVKINITIVIFLKCTF